MYFSHSAYENEDRLLWDPSKLPDEEGKFLIYLNFYLYKFIYLNFYL